MFDELFDPRQMQMMQRIAETLIEYTPPHFKVAYCIAEQCPRHGAGRLTYKIGSPQHPKEGTDRPSPELHEAVVALYRAWTQGDQPFPGLEARVEEQPDGSFSSSVKKLDLDAAKRTRDGENALWQSVHDARVKFFEARFGPLPDDIQKLLNLTGVWPGGGLYLLDAGGRGVCTTFGLTNPDLPARTRSVPAAGGPGESAFTLESRTPRWMPAGTAGYGYEIMVVSNGPADWALLPISWFAQMEILQDVDVPGRVRDGQGLTVEALKIGDGDATADFLIEAARPPFPSALTLPNGDAQLYIATRITRDEMQWALQNGRPALSERLQRAGVGQVSDLQRRSVLT